MTRGPDTLIVRILPAVFCLFYLPVVEADEPDGLEFFETRIRPVLVAHCYECHSAESDSIGGGLLVDSAAGLQQGGDSGTAVVAGDPAESLLLSAVKYESFEMPPTGRLSDEVIRDFETWIRLGAPDPRSEATVHPRPAATIDIEQGRKFWAFQPPEAHVIPDVQAAEWPRTWIDRFVLARLEQQQLQPLPDADSATLIRRLAYDLTGLPPDPGICHPEVVHDEQFLQYYIDQLLQSPQFGEHWGRHWLDVARYADSNGGDFNATFHHAWRYRNYVIETFNADRSYQQFVTEQIAGDLLPAESDDERTRNLVATGFLMLGTKMLSERDKEKLRMDVVDEQLSAIGKAFMGLTVGCARCHDHKFDPIPTRDYYALAGILRSTQTLDGEIQKYVSNWTRQPLPMTAQHRQSLEHHQQATATLEKQISDAEARLKRLDASSAEARILQQGVLLDDTQAQIQGNWKRSTYSKNYIGEGYIHDDKQDLGNKRVRFEAQLPADGRYEVRLAFPGSGGRASNVPVRIVHADGEETVLLDQTSPAPILNMLKPLGRFSFQHDQPAIVEITNTDTNGYVIVDALQFVPVQELELPNESADAQLVAKQKALQSQLAELKSQLEQLQDQAPEPAPLALAVREAAQQGDYFVCVRGEHDHLGEPVPRGFLQVAEYGGMPEVEADQSGRLALARWIADARHPLTARVYVNRVWHHLLGAGLVRSVDNFGQLGDRPSHPLLLDQLAVEFIEHGWSTRWLVREIVSSRVYRLTSAYDHDRYQADPDNRLLWRANRKPLPAESIRDTLLLAGGELDYSPGGPPVADLGTLVTQNRPDDAGVQLQLTNIRTVYQPVIRNELPTVMRVFDFADPDFVSGSRPETTVPTQALWMLNSPFLVQQAEQITERVLAEDADSSRERVQQLYLAALGRPPTAPETELAVSFLEAAGEDQTSGFRDLTHSLLASSAFRMLD